MTKHVFGLENILARESTRSDDEECRVQVLRRKIVEETRGVGRWSVIVAVNYLSGHIPRSGERINDTNLKPHVYLSGQVVISEGLVH